jgi:hypothetical protein
VEGAAAGKTFIGRMAAHQQMTHLWMDQPMDRPLIDDQPAANAGSHGQIDDAIQSLASAEKRFGQAGAIHVGIDRHRAVQGLGQKRP